MADGLQVPIQCRVHDPNGSGIAFRYRNHSDRVGEQLVVQTITMLEYERSVFIILPRVKRTGGE